VVASHFRTPQQIRTLFESAGRLLKAGGILLFSAFIAVDEYEPDALVKQMSQVMWCCVFSRREIRDVTAGLPFVLLSEESTSAYERAHLPADAWPPTGWYEGWTAGQNLFDLPTGTCPVELRWLAYGKVRNNPGH
jgi:hypothetical protein